MKTGNGAQPLEEIKIEKAVRITGGPGAITLNFLQLTGSVRVVAQYAVITEITTLTNLTGLQGTLFDGTVTQDLTAVGVALSGAPLGTLFTKDKVSTDPFSICVADQARYNEVTDEKKVGRPFTITQKNGVDTFVQLKMSTTDSPVDFIAHVTFCFIPLNGNSNLVFL
jgi:hypothetical protein